MLSFSNNDQKQCEKLGISQEVINQQLLNFENGFPFAPIIKAATVGDGIIKLESHEIDKFCAIYENLQNTIRVIKFVPASGAASRMFKDLFEFMNADSPDISNYKNIQIFFDGLSDFAFYQSLNTVISSDELQLDTLIKEEQYQLILAYILTEKGLNYGNLPKGLLLFHMYDSVPRIAAEEHLVEGINYGKSKDGKVVIHFTVSPEHLPYFQKEIKLGMEKYAKEAFDISYSIQKKSTNTIAVDLENEPFRENDGTILFRPAGHGALLSNLNELEAEVIFIKNIDNVVPDHLKSETYRYKKALAGMLLSIKKEIAHKLTILNNTAIEPAEITEIKQFVETKLNQLLPDEFEQSTDSNKITMLKSKLNRPVRVCGMVKNEGEPGGGPFWVRGSDSSISLQIVESSQIDLEEKSQKEILNQSTHFNPVDLICSTVDSLGNKFDLTQFVDDKTGFITEKSKDGKSLKAQELPGLWNGSMASWNTIFVEVPLITFNPVKTVNDLLRPQHQ